MTASDHPRVSAENEAATSDGSSRPPAQPSPAATGVTTTAKGQTDVQGAPSTDPSAAALNRPVGARPAKRRSPSGSSPVASPGGAAAASGAPSHYQGTTAPVSASVLRELRRARARKLLLRVLLLVVLPTAVSGIYFLLLASSVYESTSVVVIERRQPIDLGVSRLHEQLRSAVAGEAPSVDAKAAPKPPALGIREDALLAKEYLVSRELWSTLDRELKAREHFSSNAVDAFSRLAKDSSHEDAFSYFLKRISVTHDPSASTLTVRTKAFDAKMASRLNEASLKACEAMLNRLSARVQADQLELLERELERARVTSVRLAGNPAELSGTSKLQVNSQRAGSNTGSNASSNASSNTSSSASPSASPSAAAGGAIADPRARQAAERVEQLREGVALLRDEMAHQSRYVVRVAGPSLPDAASYPQRGRAVLTTLLASIIGMGILSLLFSAIREHTNL